MDESGLSEKLAPVKEQMKILVAEAEELRSGAALPYVQSTPIEQVESLHDIRQRIDRVEELYIRALKLKAAVAVMNNQLSDAHDERWDAIVAKQKSAAVQKGDYVGPREKYAEANVQTIESKRAARFVSEVFDHCVTMVEVIRTIKFGLEGVRGDVLAMIRVWQIETSLER